MKAYICDVCEVKAPPNTYDTQPKGWYTVYPAEGGTRHTCGAACLTQYALQEREKAVAAQESTHV